MAMQEVRESEPFNREDHHGAKQHAHAGGQEKEKQGNSKQTFHDRL